MEFKEILQRYHISPLQYQDGTVLTESDYFDLANLLLRYYYSKSLMDCQKLPKINGTLIKRAQDHCKRCLLGIDLESLMDILTEQKGGNVL